MTDDQRFSPYRQDHGALSPVQEEIHEEIQKRKGLTWFLVRNPVNFHPSDRGTFLQVHTGHMMGTDITSWQRTPGARFLHQCHHNGKPVSLQEAERLIREYLETLPWAGQSPE